MRILVIADEESKYLWDYFTPDKLDGIDLIISCGDLRAEYLEFLVTMGRVPVLYVPGNHDSRYEKRPPEGCELLDGKVYKFKDLRILGFGGSMRFAYTLASTKDDGIVNTSESTMPGDFERE